MRRVRVAVLVTCLATMLILSMGLAMGTAGCASLNNGGVGVTTVTTTQSTMAAEPSTISTTTTQVTVAPPSVTHETNSSPCLVVDAFTVGGADYIVVDYIQVSWIDDSQGGGYRPKFTNSNKKLRTFIVPPNAEMEWFVGEQDPEDIENNVEFDPDFSFKALVGMLDQINEPGVYSNWGFWNIKVSGGNVVTLKDAWPPASLYQTGG